MSTERDFVKTTDKSILLKNRRFVGKKERMADNRTKGPKKRTAQNDTDFIKAFYLCLD